MRHSPCGVDAVDIHYTVLQLLLQLLLASSAASESLSSLFSCWFVIFLTDTAASVVLRGCSLYDDASLSKSDVSHRKMSVQQLITQCIIFFGLHLAKCGI